MDMLFTLLWKSFHIAYLFQNIIIPITCTFNMYNFFDNYTLINLEKKLNLA
jgi:hypothetical protein